MMRPKGSLLWLLAVAISVLSSAVFSPQVLAAKPGPTPPPGPAIDFQVTWLGSLGGTITGRALTQTSPTFIESFVLKPVPRP
jgi:hypothetical protein